MTYVGPCCFRVQDDWPMEAGSADGQCPNTCWEGGSRGWCAAGCELWTAGCDLPSECLKDLEGRHCSQEDKGFITFLR